jgi:hypothetical protein
MLLVPMAIISWLASILFPLAEVLVQVQDINLKK